MTPASFRLRTAILATSLGCCVLAVAPGNAAAFAHDWHVTEVYSNADGSVQFVELGTQSSDEFLLTLATLAAISSGNSVSPGHDLSGSTAGRSLLFATSGFASLPGAVQPDFVIPSAFFNQNGDTLEWSTNLGDPYLGGPTTWDMFTFAAGELPSSGTASLNRALGSTAQFAAANSPTNFAGETGSLVPEPGGALLLGAALLGLAARKRKLEYGGRNF